MLQRLLAHTALILITVCSGPLLAASTENDCASKLEARQSDLALDYDGLDQTPGQGWRLLAGAGCQRQAAELIRTYLKRNSELTKGDRRNLSFHAGQVLALTNDYEEAIPFLEGALKEEDEAEDAPFQ